jgi:dTDP-4-dehydrorhamnose reductase
MIILLGASGYVGAAFHRALQGMGQPFLALSRQKVDYTRYEVLVRILKDQRPSFLVNAAGFTGKPNVDACETARADTIQGNVLFPLAVSHACAVTNTPWGHVSSGCIYSGAIIENPGGKRIVRDLASPEVRELLKSAPNALHGFSETDEPNFSFRQPPCSFYSGTKALAEEALAEDHRLYLWRLRIPFNETDTPRNYLTKLQRYPKVYDNVNSLSHLDDFVRACLELWKRRAPFGVYNVTNPGYVTTRQVVRMMKSILRPAREFEFWENDEEFYKAAAKTPRSNCVLNTEKLLATGTTMRPVEEALTDSLSNWKPAT